MEDQNTTQNSQNSSVNNHQLDLVKKSNKLIQALGSPSLLAEKVLLMSLVKVEDRDECPVSILDKEKYKRIETVTGTDFSQGLVAEVTNSEIRNFMGTKSGSYYDNIKTLLNPDKTDPRTLRNNLVFMTPDENSGVLGYTELIVGSAYDSKTGSMFIKFNPEKSIKQEIINLTTRFAVLDVPLMMKWKSIYAYRVYELISANIGAEESGRKKLNKPRKDSYTYTYEFGELKFLLGVLDATADQEVRKALSQGTKPDYNKIAEEITKNPKNKGEKGSACAKYAEFKRYALQKAEKEINECDSKDCEYMIHFEPKRNGKGGKVTHIELTVNRRNGKNGASDVIEKKNLSDDEKLDFIDSLRKTILNDLPTKELKSIAEASKYNMDVVNKAISVVEQNKNVDSKLKLMLSAIKNNWEPSTSPGATNTGGKTSFHQFKQNEYDFDKLEQVMLNSR